MQQRTIIAFTIAVAATLIMGCKHEPMPRPGAGNPGQSPGPADPINPSFVSDILPVFQSNCIGCHNQTVNNGGYIFVSYETITAKKFVAGDPEKTKLYDAITDDDEEDRMPKAPNPRLSADKIALIRNWIRNGAPNN